MSNLRIMEWNEEEFGSSKDQWNALLDNSNSDPLFLSWEWQYTWWKVFSEPAHMRLKLYVALDDNNELVGIAPLYLSVVKIKKIISLRRLQFLGNCWRGMATMRTELLDFIAIKSRSQEIITALCQYINSQPDWDEIVFVDMPISSSTSRLLQQTKPLTKSYYRIAERNDSYYLDMNNTFDDFLQGLGKNTRLKVFNRRKILEQTGSVSFERICPDDVDEKFKLLNDFHKKRWGTPAFANKRLEFNKQVAQLMAQNKKLIFSILYINNEPVSIQYNFVCNNHEYNIQAGFLESFHKKLALGYLHFGYEIEAAYDNKISIYDFLAGEGKNTQYKSSLTDAKITLMDLQVVRHKIAKLLYWLYDIYTKKFK